MMMKHNSNSEKDSKKATNSNNSNMKFSFDQSSTTSSKLNDTSALNLNEPSTSLSRGGGAGGATANLSFGLNISKFEDQFKNLNVDSSPPNRSLLNNSELFNLDTNLKHRNSTLNSQAQQPPELKLENLKAKKKTFIFNTNDLLSRPNQLLDEVNDSLSSMLDNELNKSDQNDDKITDLIDHSQFQRGIHSNRSNHRKSREKKILKGGKLTIAPNQVYEFKESDLQDLGQIGNGEFGTVHKVLHTPSQTYMALKRIGPTVGNQGERKKVLKELDFVQECHEYEFVVKFYGVKFNNEPADCLICMELMDTSLEKFYKFIYEVKGEEIPESILGKIAVATVSALNYLKEQHKIIHRDVKPSNILLNAHGSIKMCDFGISGKLVDSIAASRDAGCQLYMAPERIDPVRACAHGYDVRSDVWSLGITLFELSTGKFPYQQWKNIFHQLNLVVESDAPRLQNERLSEEFRDFVNTCLTKDEVKRPKYKTLLEHPLIVKHKQSSVDVAEYVQPYLHEMKIIKQ